MKKQIFLILFFIFSCKASILDQPENQDRLAINIINKNKPTNLNEVKIYNTEKIDHHDCSGLNAKEMRERMDCLPSEKWKDNIVNFDIRRRTVYAQSLSPDQLQFYFSRLNENDKEELKLNLDTSMPPGTTFIDYMKKQIDKDIEEKNGEGKRTFFTILFVIAVALAQ